jgi:hypothetical protein
VKDINTPEFEAWFKTQTSEIKALAASDDYLDAIEMLDLYKKDKTPAAAADLQQQRATKRTLAAGDKPNQSERAAPTDENLTAKELWNLEAKRREKRRAAAEA